MRPYLLSFALSAFALPASSQQSWSGSLSLDRSEALGDEFGGGGSLGVSASVYRWLGARIALGLELGHTRFGSNTSVVPDAVGPGTVLTEEYGWSAWHAAAVARIRLAEAGVRPFVISGIGTYWTRTRDRIEARDGSGARIPLYDFSQGRTELNPGASVGLGIEFPPVLRRFRLGGHVRWHGIVAIAPNGIGLVDFVTVGVSGRLALRP